MPTRLAKRDSISASSRIEPSGTVQNYNNVSRTICVKLILQYKDLPKKRGRNISVNCTLHRYWTVLTVADQGVLP